MIGAGQKHLMDTAGSAALTGASDPFNLPKELTLHSEYSSIIEKYVSVSISQR